ncbi:MAG: His-Xaa-Ser system protein HxsD [Parcubacteria group bacterium]|jgi:His-Xaa-Ser system protein HxsD
MKKNLGDNAITFSLNTNIYTPEIIYKTCYVFIDRMYIYLDQPEKNLITASLRGKRELNQGELKKLEGEFFNELLNTKLREEISRKNAKLLEYIVGGAINAALEKDENSGKDEFADIEKEIRQLDEELAEMDKADYKKDSLNIRQIKKINKKK